MYFARGVFYVSAIGVALSAIFRERFDGAAFVFTVIAVMAFIVNLYLEAQQEERNNERYYNDFD